MGVATTDGQDQPVAGGNGGPEVDVAAPGEDLYTTAPGGGAGTLTGSSAAAAVVSGGMAVLAGASGKSGSPLAQQLLSSAEDVAGDPHPDGAPQDSSETYGEGTADFQQTTSGRVTRESGDGRIKTSIAIRRAATDEADVRTILVVPANGEASDEASGGWRETLPAASLLADGATAYLMTFNDRMPPETLEELELLMRDGAGKRIVIVGDAESSVNQSVESQLRDMYGDQVERLQGAEGGAVSTAVAVADALGGQPEGALIATVGTWPDALGMASVAATEALPLLYVDSDSVPDATCTWLEGHPSVRTLYVAGGTAAVSDAASAAARGCLAAGGPTAVVRAGGAERVATGVAIAREFFPRAGTALLATQGNWPDAMTGSMLARVEGGPTLLASYFYDPGSGQVIDDALDQGPMEYVCTAISEGAAGFVLGGTGVVTEAKKVAFEQTLDRCPVADVEGAPVAAPPDAVAVGGATGGEIQAALDANPQGTAFLLTSDSYQIGEPLEPRAGQRIYGRPERGATVLTGLEPVSNWQQRGDGMWSSTGMVTRFCVHGEYADPTALMAEDLFLDGAPLHQIPYETVQQRLAVGQTGLGPDEFAVQYVDDGSTPDDEARTLQLDRDPGSEPGEPGYDRMVVRPVAADSPELGPDCLVPSPSIAGDTLLIGQQPSPGAVYEINAASAALEAAEGADGGTLANVTVRGFGNAAQRGAVDVADARGWELTHLDVSLAHGAGVRLGGGLSSQQESRLSRSVVHGNGQLGVSVTGIEDGTEVQRDDPPARDIVVERNELTGNNYAGYDAGWEAGGAKFTLTDGLIVDRNWSHGNAGGGLWTDIYARATLVTENLVTDNDRAGIWHEISYDATIRGNTTARNGQQMVSDNDVADLYGSSAGIFISSSGSPDGQPPILVTENVVRSNRHGIAVVAQGDGQAGGPEVKKRDGAVEVDGVQVIDNLIDGFSTLAPSANPKPGVVYIPHNGVTGFLQDYIKEPDCDDDSTPEPEQCPKPVMDAYNAELRALFSTDRVAFAKNRYRSQLSGGVAPDFLAWCNDPLIYARWRGIPQDPGSMQNGMDKAALEYSCPQ